MKLHKFAIGAALIGFGFGCAPYGTYRVVKVTKDSGELAINGDKVAAREKANAYMAQQCGGGYEVVEEGEAVIGENAQAERTFLGGVQSTTTQKTEWRIKFACKHGAASPAAPSAAPAAAPVSAQVRVIAIRF